MKLTFLGAAQEVGKSCLLVESGVKLLLDAGIKINDKNETPDFHNVKADALVLSHAHLDHSGSAPMLFKHHPIPAFATFPTIPLVAMLWEDSEKISLQNKQSLPYSKRDVDRLLKHAVPLPYESEYEFYEGTSFSFLDAGHILGSAQVLVRNKQTLLYTGDFKPEETRLHNAARPPSEHVDVLITESTYGNRAHPERKKLEEDFCNAVEEALDEEKTILVPCFAVGRAQEMLLVLQAHRVDADVYVDGMAKSVCSIMTDYQPYVKSPGALKQALQHARFVETSSQRKALTKKPCVIISSAGMLDGGPVLSYLNTLDKSNNGVVLLTGYQVEGSNGRALLTGKPLRFNGDTRRVSLPFKHFDFSAHASKTDLIDYAKRVNPTKIFCVHGDKEACDSLADALKEGGFDAKAPALGEKIEV